jgi:hypothetical protein
VCTTSVITRQLEAAEVLYKQSTMNNKSSFVKDPLVITKQLKLYFNNSSRMPTQETNVKIRFSPLLFIKDTLQALELVFLKNF